MSSMVPWDEFDRDPRSPDLAPLRASDRDRELALRILSEAYAEGRLARDEFDERVDAVHAVRTLGELPGQLADLVPAAHQPGTAIAPAEHRAKAVAKYERERREAVWTFLSVSIICWVVWAVTDSGFLWPLFPMVFTGLNAARVLYQREDIISGDLRRREKREAKALREQERKRERRQLPPAASPDDDEAPTS